MEVGGDKNEIKIAIANLTGEGIKYEVTGRGQFLFVIGYNNNTGILEYLLLLFAFFFPINFKVKYWKSFLGNLTERSKYVTL